MPRRKKYPKLPNGFGSIKKLSGKNRVNPYGVYPPTTEFDPEGHPVPVKAIAYVDDWLYGVSILTAYQFCTRCLSPQTRTANRHRHSRPGDGCKGSSGRL